MRPVVAVARATTADLARRRGAWVSAVLIGLLFAGLLLGVGSATGRLAERADDRSFRVAVSGDVEGGEDLLAALDADARLVVVETDDPEQRVTDRAFLVGLVLPEGADASFAAGDLVDFAISYRSAEALSSEAFATLAIRLQAIEAQTLAERAALNGVDLPAKVTTDVVEVRGDTRVERLALARQVAAAAVLLGVGVVSAVSGVLGGARDRRGLEPLLVLPLSHGRLAFGLTLGASPVAMAQLGAGVLLLVANAAVPFSTFAQPLGVVVAMATGGLVAVAVLGLLASATGCLAGALGTGTDEAVGLGDLLAVPFVAVGVTLFLAPDLPATVVTCAVPILGQALLVREAVGGTLSPTCAAAALLSAAATVALLMAAAGRALGRERRLAGAAT